MNFSVFHYEVLKDPKKAIQLADAALQQALDKIDELGEEEFRDAKSIIELLKENLTLWKEEEEGGNDIQDLWAPSAALFIQNSGKKRCYNNNL